MTKIYHGAGRKYQEFVRESCAFSDEEVEMKWTETPPNKAGYYWWRASPDVEEEILYVELSGHKPPYWVSWGLCHGGPCKDEEDPRILSLNLNYNGDGPVESGYEDVEPLRGGVWWPEQIEKPPRLRL